MEKDTGLVGADGKPLKTVNVPIVKFDDFIFPMHMVEQDEMAQVTEKGVKPSDIIREMRAVGREMRHRFTILAAGLVLASQKGPEEVERFLNSIGLVITDIKGNKFFEPKLADNDQFIEEDEGEASSESSEETLDN